MVLIPPGEFLMGSPAAEIEAISAWAESINRDAWTKSLIDLEQRRHLGYRQSPGSFSELE